MNDTDNMQGPIQSPANVPSNVEKFTQALLARNTAIADKCFAKAKELRAEADRLENMGRKLDEAGPATAEAIKKFVSFVEDAATNVSSLALVGHNGNEEKQ